MRFETTIAGSLPKPPWLAEPARLWPDWRLSGEELRAAQRDAVRVALFEQECAGIDVVTDGEAGRAHFVHGFAAALDGIDAIERKRRGIRGDRYQADCPRIVAEIRRRAPVFAPEVQFARATTRKLKVTLPGPMTLADTLVDEFYGERKAAAFACAHALAEEIADCVRAGADVVQLDEPAFNVYFDEVDEWGIAALDAAFGEAECERAVHVCYGYGIEANVAWKRGLGAEWDQYEVLFPMLERSRADVVLMELAGSRVPPRVLDLLPTKRVAVGVIDVATERVETPEEVARTIAVAREHLPDARIACTTNCGMAPMEREVAYAKLRALGAGARIARDAGGG